MKNILKYLLLFDRHFYCKLNFYLEFEFLVIPDFSPPVVIHTRSESVLEWDLIHSKLKNRLETNLIELMNGAKDMNEPKGMEIGCNTHVIILLVGDNSFKSSVEFETLLFSSLEQLVPFIDSVLFSLLIIIVMVGGKSGVVVIVGGGDGDVAIDGVIVIAAEIVD